MGGWEAPSLVCCLVLPALKVIVSLEHSSRPASLTLHTPLVQLGASAGQAHLALQAPWHNCLQVPSPVPVHRWVVSGQRQLVHLAPVTQMGCNVKGDHLFGVSICMPGHASCKEGLVVVSGSRSTHPAHANRTHARDWVAHTAGCARLVGHAQRLQGQAPAGALVCGC